MGPSLVWPVRAAGAVEEAVGYGSLTGMDSRSNRDRESGVLLLAGGLAVRDSGSSSWGRSCWDLYFAAAEQGTHALSAGAEAAT